MDKELVMFSLFGRRGGEAVLLGAGGSKLLLLVGKLITHHVGIAN